MKMEEKGGTIYAGGYGFIIYVLGVQPLEGVSKKPPTSRGSSY